MALNFPNSPATNDTHTEAGRTWKWNGTAWDHLGEFPEPVGVAWDFESFNGGDPLANPVVDGYITLHADLDGALPAAVYENKRANLASLVTLAGDLSPTLTGAWDIGVGTGTPKKLILTVYVQAMDTSGFWNDNQTIQLNSGWLDWATTGGIGSDGQTFLPAGPVTFLAANPEP